MTPDWKTPDTSRAVIRIVRTGELDACMFQRPVMWRAAAITHSRTICNSLRAATPVVETLLNVRSGCARMRRGERQGLTDQMGFLDLIYAPPDVPHPEMNARDDEPVECVVARSGQEPAVVNLNTADANNSPLPFHRAGDC